MLYIIAIVKYDATIGLFLSDKYLEVLDWLMIEVIWW